MLKNMQMNKDSVQAFNPLENMVFILGAIILENKEIIEKILIL
jgi:hypothetical protein